jgi:NADPH:quinone reductase
MLAVAINAFGGAEVLEVAETATPTPGEGEVLVRVHAAAVNPIDYKTRQGQGVTRGWQGSPFPLILGWDISGVVERPAGDFKVGDAVYGMVRFPARGSAYAEFVAAPVTDIAAKPHSIDHNHAAAVPLAALTAWQALFVAGGLQSRQTVLVHAGAGGVGHFAVQLAKWKGARVIATCSTGNADFVSSLGADQVIDYTREDFSDAAKDVDLVFQTIGADKRAQSFKTLKPGGILVSITGQVPPEEVPQGLRAAFVSVRPNAGQLAELARLIDAGRLRPMIDRTFRLVDVAQAHRHVEGGHTRGKVVLEVA